MIIVTFLFSSILFFYTPTTTGTKRLYNTTFRKIFHTNAPCAKAENQRCTSMKGDKSWKKSAFLFFLSQLALIIRERRGMTNTPQRKRAGKKGYDDGIYETRAYSCFHSVTYFVHFFRRIDRRIRAPAKKIDRLIWFLSKTLKIFWLSRWQYNFVEVRILIFNSWECPMWRWTIVKRPDWFALWFALASGRRKG